MDKNIIWVIEWKTDAGWAAIEFEYKQKEAIAYMNKYKESNPKLEYSIDKYVSEAK